MDGNERGAALTVYLEAGPRAVSGALAGARAFMRSAGCGGDMQARIAIIVEELVFNIVEHGRAPPGDPIELMLRRRGDAVELILIDGGAAFDIRHAPPPGDPPPERGGSAGVALVLAWSCEVDYAREGGRNRLALTITGD
jgi:serine/threonine-protein kinase RsbW